MDIPNADPNPPRTVHKKPITMGARGAVYIPEAVRSHLELKQGDMFQVSVEDGRIVLTPATMVPAASFEPKLASEQTPPMTQDDIDRQRSYYAQASRHTEYGNVAGFETGEG